MTKAVFGQVNALRASDDAGDVATAGGQRKRGMALEEAILEATFAELSEAGLAGFTVEGVAARAHTGKASIYRRWPNKSELLLDAMSAHLPSAAECGFETTDIPDDVTTAQALRQVADMISSVLAGPVGDVVRAIKCESGVDPELARAIDDRFQKPRRQCMIDLLNRGVARGEVRAGADTAAVADVIPSVITYRLLLQREPMTSADINRVFEEIILPLIEPR